MEDRFILEGIRREDQACLRELFDKYGKYAAAVCVKVGGGSLTNQDVEEITSDVFLRIWKAAENIRLEGKGLKAYVGMTARNLTLNVLRKKSCIPVELLEDESAASPSAEDLYFREENHRAFQEVIINLKEIDRIIMIRRYFYLDKVGDIARYLNMSEKAVSARIARAKQLVSETCRQKGVL